MITKIREALRGQAIPILVITALFMVIFVARAIAETIDFRVDKVDHYYEANLTSTMVIGVMPRVALTAVGESGQPLPGAKVCGRWYQNGVPANVPNGDWPMTSYCRTTFEDGSTFFAMRSRFNTWHSVDTWYGALEDLSGYNISFRVESMELSGFNYITEFEYIPVDM